MRKEERRRKEGKKEWEKGEGKRKDEILSMLELN